MAVTSPPSRPHLTASRVTPASLNASPLAQKATRGGLAISFAKAWFIFSGFVHQTLLPHVIGLAGYGAFASIQAIANIPNNVVVTASIQGVSRAVAGSPQGVEDATARRILRIHALLAPLLALAFFFAAPGIAALQKAPHLGTPLRIFAVVVLVYGLYAPLVGVLNGSRRFLAQAALDITSATFRTALILGVAWVFARRGHGVLGAAIGVALAALLILPVALKIMGRLRTGQAKAGPSARQHLALLLPVAITQLCLNLALQADISLLRPLATSAGSLTGLQGAALLQSTDELVGAYRAAQLFAFLPYQFLIALGFILFPMLARAKAEGDTIAVQRFTRTGVRMGLLLAGLMVACISGLAPHFLRFAFPEKAAEIAGSTLRILALGQGAFAIFGIQTTALISLGRERQSAALTAIAAALIALFCFLIVPGTSFGPALLVRTASATSLALGMVAVGGAFLLLRAAGSFASPATLARVGIALSAALYVGQQLPWMGRIAFLGEVGLVSVIYLAVLALTRELTLIDLGLIRAILGRNQKTS